MGRKSQHNLPPGIQLDQHGQHWATLEGDDAKRWREIYPGRSLPRRKAADLKAALKLQRQIVDDMEKGRDPNAENPRVSVWVQTCIDRKRDAAPSTTRRYQSLLKWQIESHTIGRMRIRQVRKQHVETWVDKLIAQKRHGDATQTLHPYSIRAAYTLLRMAFNRAVADGLIPKNPCKDIELPRINNDETHPLTPDQVNILLTMLGTFERGYPHRNAAVYHVAIRCGLRLGELLGLRWEDVDLDRRELRVSGQMQSGQRSARGKSPRARRALSLSVDTTEALRWHKQNQAEEKAIGGKKWNADGLVFCSQNGTPLHPNNVERQFDTLLRKAELPDIRFHDMRHTYAALSIAAGVDLYTLSRRMGHSSISVTADRYGHLYATTQDADALDRLLKRA